MSKFNNPRIRKLEDIYNHYTLNIFSDASTLNCGNRTAGCYGVIAVCMDNPIDSVYRIHSDTTTNLEEGRGMKSAIELGLRYRYNFKNINIFCDSALSIIGLRDYTQGWTYNDNNLYKKSDHKQVANQTIFVESYNMAIELMRTNLLGLFHISGHVNFDNSGKSVNKSIKKALHVFYKENHIPFNENIDINMIRYLCTYNNFVDHGSRSFLYRSDVKTNLSYIDPIRFIPNGQLLW